MTPGRELDALVAEKVMEWKVDYIPRFGAAVLVGGLSGIACPPYSTDIGAAWEVVEKVPYALCLMRVDGKWRAQFWEFGKYTSRPQGEADAPTAPHAICLAALRALGVEGV